MENDRPNPTTTSTTMTTKLQISFRGKKVEMILDDANDTVGRVKERLVTAVANDDDDVAGGELTAKDVRLLYRGKILADDDVNAKRTFETTGRRSKTTTTTTTTVVAVHKLVAMGVPRTEVEALEANARGAARSRFRVRDDLTDEGQRNEAARRRRGRAVLSAAAARNGGASAPRSRFGRIETLPMLPEQSTARKMLEELANDVGIRTCMERRGWTVGCLAELFPEGNVGESPVCVMGLNQNRGQKILLRLRTDDLKGFRKPLSVRKVLYHELAHNVHDEHDDKFFRLMREIERECTDADWTRSDGNQLSTRGTSRRNDDVEDDGSTDAFVGGSGRLGGSSTTNLSKRELTLRAAVKRMSPEEEEIQRNCGCGRSGHDFGASFKDGQSESVRSKTLLADIDGVGEEEKGKES